MKFTTMIDEFSKTMVMIYGSQFDNIEISDKIVVKGRNEKNETGTNVEIIL